MLHLLGIPVELDVPGRLYDLFAKNGLIATTVVFVAGFFGLLRVHLTTVKEHSQKFEKVITDLRDDYAESRALAATVADVLKSMRKPARRSRKEPVTEVVPRKAVLSDD